MDDGETFKVKRVCYNGREVPIFLQNKNGPCPLLAISNILSLRNELRGIGPSSTTISQKTLVSIIAEKILDSKVDLDIPNRQTGVDECLGVLDKLCTGIDVNVKFDSITGFEKTPETSPFELLGIRLVHGWLVDPSDLETARIIDSKSYNELVEYICSFDEDATPGTSLLDPSLTPPGSLPITPISDSLNTPSGSNKHQQLANFYHLNAASSSRRQLPSRELLVSLASGCENAVLDPSSMPLIGKRKSGSSPIMEATRTSNTTSLNFSEKINSVANKESRCCDSNVTVASPNSDEAKICGIMEKNDSGYEISIGPSDVMETKELSSSVSIKTFPDAKINAETFSSERPLSSDNVLDVVKNDLADGALQGSSNMLSANLVGQGVSKGEETMKNSSDVTVKAGSTDTEHQTKLIDLEDFFLMPMDNTPIKNKEGIVPSTLSSPPFNVTGEHDILSVARHSIDAHVPSFSVPSIPPSISAPLNARFTDDVNAPSSLPSSLSKASSALPPPSSPNGIRTPPFPNKVLNETSFTESPPRFAPDSSPISLLVHATLPSDSVLINDAVVDQKSDYKSPSDQEKALEAAAKKAYASIIMRDFFDASCTQLTYPGLSALVKGLNEGELAVFFRNNHFNVIRRGGIDNLFLLVTDQGYLNEKDVVWESLNSIEGDATFFDGSFQAFSCHLASSPHKQPSSASTIERVNGDSNAYGNSIDTADKGELHLSNGICSRNAKLIEAYNGGMSEADAAAIAAALNEDEDYQIAISVAGKGGTKRRPEEERKEAGILEDNEDITTQGRRERKLIEEASKKNAGEWDIKEGSNWISQTSSSLPYQTGEGVSAHRSSSAARNTLLKENSCESLKVISTCNKFQNANTTHSIPSTLVVAPANVDAKDGSKNTSISFAPDALKDASSTAKATAESAVSCSSPVPLSTPITASMISSSDSLQRPLLISSSISPSIPSQAFSNPPVITTCLAPPSVSPPSLTSPSSASSAESYPTSAINSYPSPAPPTLPLPSPHALSLHAPGTANAAAPLTLSSSSLSSSIPSDIQPAPTSIKNNVSTKASGKPSASSRPCEFQGDRTPALSSDVITIGSTNQQNNMLTKNSESLAMSHSMPHVTDQERRHSVDSDINFVDSEFINPEFLDPDFLAQQAAILTALQIKQENSEVSAHEDYRVKSKERHSKGRALVTRSDRIIERDENLNKGVKGRNKKGSNAGPGGSGNRGEYIDNKTWYGNADDDEYYDNVDDKSCFNENDRLSQDAMEAQRDDLKTLQKYSSQAERSTSETKKPLSRAHEQSTQQNKVQRQRQEPHQLPQQQHNENQALEHLCQQQEELFLRPQQRQPCQSQSSPFPNIDDVNGSESSPYHYDMDADLALAMHLQEQEDVASESLERCAQVHQAGWIDEYRDCDVLQNDNLTRINGAREGVERSNRNLYSTNPNVLDDPITNHLTNRNAGGFYKKHSEDHNGTHIANVSSKMFNSDRNKRNDRMLDGAYDARDSSAENISTRHYLQNNSSDSIHYASESTHRTNNERGQGILRGALPPNNAVLNPPAETPLSSSVSFKNKNGRESNGGGGNGGGGKGKENERCSIM
mmetsp:Transcript_10793/g.19685  ORF Transcript_10793/g.19685 Transcript_10793/m.19685 type:complete len:1587 (-) Transcript_10793:243-5003(-)